VFAYQTLDSAHGTADADIAGERGAVMNPPVFLGAPTERELKVIRGALAAHPHFFTSHLPVDDPFALCAWARVMRETPSSRRPVWLSACAFDCIDALKQALPGALFVRVVGEPHNARADCLEVVAARLLTDPATELARVFEFLGEPALSAPVLLRRCA
jgi:hypothetical protein